MKKDLFINKFTANDESIKIIEWLVANDDYVQKGQSIVLIETSKTNIEIESEAEGYILQLYAAEHIIRVGEKYASVFDSMEALQNFKTNPAIVSHNVKQEKAEHRFSSTFSNAALEYLQTHQLDPEDFLDQGFVTVEKIKSKLQESEHKKSHLDPIIFPNASKIALPFSKLSEIVNLTKVTQHAIISSLTVQLETEEIKKYFSEVIWLNRRIFPYILSVFSKLLTTRPNFISYYHEQHIILYNKINLGIAIDLGKGLKVMVIEDPEKLSLFELQMALIDNITAYHENTTCLHDIKPSTVTVTDLSQDNILYFQPVLNTNQAIILGIGGDQTLPGSPISLTIVFDHRILSGQEVAVFLKEFKEKLLSEYRLLDLNSVATQ